jgi:hypothetical protein
MRICFANAPSPDKVPAVIATSHFYNMNWLFLFKRIERGP